MKAIDLFAGAGGFTEGARLAGIDVIWAANHWPVAVEAHAANHPETVHACQDLHEADWSKVPAHDLLLGSPCCQGHARARGKDRPHHDESRATAWAIVSAAEYHRPAAIVLENVPEFRQWSLYPSWIDAMRRLGYRFTERVIDAADHGVPQNRERLFLVAGRDRAPLALELATKPHQAIGPSIAWDRHNWSEVDKPGRSPATLARVAAGRREHGRRFVMPYYGSGSGRTGRSLDRPLGTVTTRDRWAVVDGDRMRMLQLDEYRAAMGFRPDYALPTSRKRAIHLLGNAVCPPVVRDVLEAVGRELAA